MTWSTQGAVPETLANNVIHTTTEIFTHINRPPRANTFSEIYETFSAATSAPVVGSNGPINVQPDTLYYTLQLGEWHSRNSSTSHLKLTFEFRAFGINPTADADPFSVISDAQTVTTYVNDPLMHYSIIEPLFVTVDGVQAAVARLPYIQSTPAITYNTDILFPVPKFNASVTFQIKTSTPQNINVATDSGNPGWYSAALGVGIVFGLSALFAVIAVGTYLFCYAPWLKAWAVISLPGRKVLQKIESVRKPAAPTFDVGMSYDDDDEGDEEDGLLAEERVDPGELLKQGLMAAVVKPTGRQGVLKKLTHAMGRRLSNFIGWDGKPVGESSAGSESKSEKKTRKQMQQQRANSVIAKQMEASSSRPGIELESSIASAILGGVTRADSRIESSDIESSSEPLHAKAEDTTPPRLRNIDNAGSSSDIDVDSARGDTPPRAKKAFGLRGFKITAHTPTPSQVESSTPPRDPHSSDEE